MPPKLPTALKARKSFSMRTRGQSVARKLNKAQFDTSSLPVPAEQPPAAQRREQEEPGDSKKEPTTERSLGAAKQSFSSLAELQNKNEGLREEDLNATTRSARPRSLTLCTAPPTAPEEDEIITDDIEAVFWVRSQDTTSRLKRVSSADNGATWKRRLVRLALSESDQAAARLEIFAIQNVKGKESEVEIKTDALRLSIPLQKLELVRKGQISENKPLEFLTSDDDGRYTREYKFGQLMFSLHFADDQLTAPLDFGCPSTSERDAWHDWFTSYIVHCELKAVRSDAENAYEVDQRFLGEPPGTGVAKFVNTFIAGAKTVQKEDDKPSEPPSIRKPPCKGKISVRVTEDTYQERKISCPGRGRITISGGLRVPTETIDLTTCLVMADTPWGSNFFIRLSTTAVSQLNSVANKKKIPFDIHENRMELRTSLSEDRAKMIDWILFCKGVEQSQDETYPYEAKERLEQEAHERESENIARSSQRKLLIGAPSRESEDRSSSQQSPETQSVLQAIDDSQSVVMSGTYSRGFDDSSNDLFRKADPLVANPITDEEEMHLVLGPKEDIPGSWAYVEFNAIGGHPTEGSSFTKRLVSFDSAARRIYAVQGPDLADVAVDVLIDDIFAITGYSKVYGAAGFTLHCKQGVEIMIVPENSALLHVALQASAMSEKVRWLTALQNAEVPFEENRSREEVNTDWLLEQRKKFQDGALNTRVVTNGLAEGNFCRLCGEEKRDTIFCAATQCVHPQYLEKLEEAVEKSSSEDILPPKRVVPKDTAACIEETEAVLRRLEDATKAFEGYLVKAAVKSTCAAESKQEPASGEHITADQIVN